MPDQILGQHWKKLNFQAKFELFKGPPLPKYKDVSKTFSYDQTSYVIALEQVKFVLVIACFLGQFGINSPS